ncbi:hypothetical protein HJG60_008231 [Phyllostomus discolor]|uniref:Uncharacterized protein n=1 Tax=Phyllostomus discolor TaxID=89673 RepID=A0A834DQ61_9CHIR|nr:hypothetical protein HJG60_008231 [Phyllostomus discolor]
MLLGPTCHSLLPSLLTGTHCAPGQQWNTQGRAREHFHATQSLRLGAEEIHPCMLGRRERSKRAAFPHTLIVKASLESPALPACIFLVPQYTYQAAAVQVPLMHCPWHLPNPPPFLGWGCSCYTTTVRSNRKIPPKIKNE